MARSGLGDEVMIILYDTSSFVASLLSRLRHKSWLAWQFIGIVAPGESLAPVLVWFSFVA